MKRKDPNNSQRNGYPPQDGYGPDTYPGGMTYPGYSAPQGYAQPQGYPQQEYAQPQTQGYPQGQGYGQPQGYAQPQGYQTGRNYQTPQVTGNQPSAGVQEGPSGYTGQAGYAPGRYPPQGYGQQPSGYPGTPPYAQTGYPQTNTPGGTGGYPYTGNQQAAGSYIPQTPYQPNYPGTGYPPQGGYAQGYNAYQQMGRGPQTPVNPQQEMGQVPLNGGGYVPQPVPVRKQPFVMTDAYLLMISGVLLVLFAVGMFVPGLAILRWVFLALAGGTIALLWIRPMVEKNKRLCYTIVFGLLMIITIIGFITAGAGGGSTADPQQVNRDPYNSAVSGQAQETAGVPGPSATSTPSVTNTPEPDMDGVVIERLRMFFSYWAANRQDDMLTLCSPTWASKEENPKTALFHLMANRTPREFDVESISGTSNDTSRTVTVTSLMDRNNGKPAVKYRLSVVMDKENDGQWYVNPKSLQTYENAETPDPSVTSTPAATATPYVDSKTTLYYNTDGGKYYHLDPNCKTTNPKFLPFKGHFSYSELNNDKYKELKPCAICGAPSRGQ